jgi:hypothetical protein
MLNCYFGLSVRLIEKTVTVVTTVSGVWPKTYISLWGHQLLFRENIIILHNLKEITVLQYILFKNLSLCNNSLLHTE